MKTQLNGFAGCISSSFWFAMDDQQRVSVVIHMGSGFDKSVYVKITFFDDEGKVIREEEEGYNTKSFEHFLRQITIVSHPNFGLSENSEKFIESIEKLKEVGPIKLIIALGEASFSTKKSDIIDLLYDEAISLYDFFYAINEKESL